MHIWMIYIFVKWFFISHGKINQKAEIKFTLQNCDMWLKFSHFFQYSDTFLYFINSLARRSNIMKFLSIQLKVIFSGKTKIKYCNWNQSEKWSRNDFFYKLMRTRVIWFAPFSELEKIINKQFFFHKINACWVKFIDCQINIIKWIPDVF